MGTPDLLLKPNLLLEHGLFEQVTGFLEPRAPALDNGDAGIHDSLAFLNERLLRAAAEDRAPNADLLRVAETIATAAWSDMATAFSLWCHRMVLEYLSCAPPHSPLQTTILPRLLRTELLGSTALAAAMAHHVSQAPLPVHWRTAGDAVVVDGRVSWASNLFPPDFVMVTAAAHTDDGRARIVVLPGGSPGVCVDPYPRLLALQATGSSSIVLRGACLPADWVIADDFTGFISRVRPTFLLLQSSFCWGLAGRALAEACAALRGVNEVFGGDLEPLEQQAAHLAAQIRAAVAAIPAARDGGSSAPIRHLVRLRLEAAQLATAAVALEAKVVGGRGYVITSPTARRLREAAFLPVQAPTEGQLRWELSRSA